MPRLHRRLTRSGLASRTWLLGHLTISESCAPRAVTEIGRIAPAFRVSVLVQLRLCQVARSGATGAKSDRSEQQTLVAVRALALPNRQTAGIVEAIPRLQFHRGQSLR